MKYTTGPLLIMLVLLLASCKKYKDTPGGTDPRLNRPYCNDPAAVNYNWDFPGTPDNSVCIYPAGVFTGSYTYTDSIYDANQVFQKQQVLQLNITSSSQSRITIAGLCASGNVSLTASRRLRADVDTVVGYGQLLCRPSDTLTGAITRPGLSGNIQFNLTVSSDTGVNYHRGSAVKN